MKKIKAFLLSLLSLSVVGAIGGCSLLGADSSSESSPTNSESSTPEASTPDASTPDASTPDEGGNDDVTPEGPATPVSGEGTYDAPYVIEAGKTYVASKDAQDSVYFTITTAQSGTYTFNLPETNEGAPYIEITGVNEVANGTTFIASAGATVNIMISNTDWDENWNTIFFDTTFSVDFVAGDITPDGSALAPIALENGTTYTVGGWEQVWYSFTAPSAGQYKLSLTDWAAQSDSFSFYNADWDTFERGVAIDIAEGESIAFNAYSFLDDASTWTFSFAATLENDANYDVPESNEVGTENNPFTIEAVGDYEITVAAGATYCAKFMGGAFQFVVPEGVKVFLYGMNSGYVTAGAVVAFTDFAMWNQEMYFDIINEGAEDATITLSVSEYVAPQVLQVGANPVVLTEDNYSTGVECTFTATVSGAYTFGTGGSFMYQVLKDGMLVGNHMTGPVNLEAGVTYTVMIGGIMAGDYTLTITAPETGDVGGGDVGGDDVGGEDTTDPVLVVGSNTVTITDDNIDVETGLLYTFTPEANGTCQFKGNLMCVVMDENFDELTKTSGKYTLSAGTTYYVVIYNFMPGMINAGDHTITVQFEEIVEEEEVEVTDIFSAPIVTVANSATKVLYTVVLTETMNLTFTFDNEDTWFHFRNVETNQDISGSKQAVFEGVLPAGTYEMGIGTWDAAELTLTLTVTGTTVGGNTDGEAGDVVTYLGAAASGRAMQVTIDAAAGTVSVIRAALAGNSLDTTKGATEYTGTYSFDGTTVTCEISGCTITWNADGSVATVTWGSAVYENFVVA